MPGESTKESHKYHRPIGLRSLAKAPQEERLQKLCLLWQEGE